MRKVTPAMRELVDNAHKAGELEANGNIDAALKLAEQCANRGCTASMALIAQIYHEGRPGRAQDLKKAFHWFKRCADHGPSEMCRVLGTPDEARIECMRLLGHLYWNGLGVDQNLDEAERWLKAGAEAMCCACMNDYASFLMDIRRGTHAEQESLRWLNASAEVGYRYMHVSLYVCVCACV